jgi:hypothetical protein
LFLQREKVAKREIPKRQQLRITSKTAIRPQEIWKIEDLPHFSATTGYSQKKWNAKHPTFFREYPATSAKLEDHPHNPFSQKIKGSKREKTPTNPVPYTGA